MAPDPSRGPSRDPDTVLIRIEALELQVAALRTIVGANQPGTDPEKFSVMARLRALEEAAAAGRTAVRRDKDA